MNKLNKLKNIRIKNDLTYDDMAKLLHISKTFYWQIENGKRRIYYQKTIEIAKIFNLKPDELFYEDFI
jgi:putative transcriptional regulator